MRRTAIAIIASLAASIAAAAHGGDGSIDIHAAIEMTLENNISLRTARVDRQLAQADVVGAEGLWTPTLTLDATTSRARERQTSDGSDRHGTVAAYARLQQTIWSGGRNTAQIRSARRGALIAGLRIADAENAAIGELFARFYYVLLQQGRIDAERSAVSTSEAHLRELERMNELGLSNRLEVIRAEQQLATNRAGMIAAEGQYDTAIISLMNYMAMQPEPRIDISGELHVIEVSGDRASSLAAALLQRADRAALAEQIELQRDQRAAARAGTMPRVTLSATTGWLDPYLNSDRGGDTWRAEIALTVPILDRNETRSAVMSAMARQDHAELSLQQNELDIKSGIESAWTELERTSEHLDAAARALELAKESLRLAEVGFQEGVTPQLDLLTAQTALTEARLSHLSALYDRMIAAVAIKVAEGDMIPWARGADF